MSVGPTARLDVPALLTALDRYPYGCAEQTISRALPLLYVNNLSKDLGIAKDTKVKARIQKALIVFLRCRMRQVRSVSGAQVVLTSG